MKRIFIFSGIVTALVGVAVILPALANYGRPGPMASDALKFLLLGSFVTIAGGSAIFHGARKHKA